MLLKMMKVWLESPASDNLTMLTHYGPREPVFSVGREAGNGDVQNSRGCHLSYGIYGSQPEAKASLRKRHGVLAQYGVSMQRDIAEYWNLNHLLEHKDEEEWEEVRESRRNK